MLTVNEVAERLAVHPRTVRLWIEQGKLIAYQFGRPYMIEESDLTDFINKSKIIRKEEE